MLSTCEKSTKEPKGKQYSGHNAVTGTQNWKGVLMASETFKKRQKEMARREKKQKKAARLMERRTEKAKVSTQLEEEKPKAADLK